jgi:PTH1 family peptidyl-tRNA hydrolase
VRIAVFLIIGLGNPGSEYEETRHNIGFRVVDALAEQLGTTFRSGNGLYYIGWASDRSIGLAKPTTYMNNSGVAVMDLIERHRVSLDRILIVVDDFHLPIGTIRIRRKGSDGGHNGLYSIIYHLQSDEFPRLRCGIGSDAMPSNKKEMSTFVLSQFVASERSTVQTMVQQARDAALVAAREGIDAAIQRVHGART